MLPDKIILSSNEDPTYLEFWKPVSWAYKKMFPTVEIHLALLSNRTYQDDMVRDLAEYGHVTLFPVLPDIPEPGQAKMLRFLLAAKMGNSVCYIDDIDLFPLRADFITSKLMKRPEGVLLCVGGEVYGFDGTYPISQMTAEGYVWRKFINPHNRSDAQILRSFKDKAQFHHNENINIWPDMVGDRKDYYFSDEKLLKRLLYENPVPKLEIRRGYADYLEATIDRATYNKETDKWEFDKAKLLDGGYANAHCLRPFKKHEEKFVPLFEYINRCYGQG